MRNNHLSISHYRWQVEQIRLEAEGYRHDKRLATNLALTLLRLKKKKKSRSRVSVTSVNYLQFRSPEKPALQGKRDYVWREIEPCNKILREK